jgi:CheY-like chemotaxis protein
LPSSVKDSPQAKQPRHGRGKNILDRLLPARERPEPGTQSLGALLEVHGFDPEHHEQIRADLQRGLIGLAQNRLPASSVIEDVRAEEVADASDGWGHRLSGWAGKPWRRAAASELPRLILLDLMMPVMDGWQFLRERAAQLTLADIPVLVMTGGPSPTDTGVAEIIAKPVDMTTLLEKIGRHC